MTQVLVFRDQKGRNANARVKRETTTASRMPPTKSINQAAAQFERGQNLLIRRTVSIAGVTGTYYVVVDTVGSDATQCTQME